MRLAIVKFIYQNQKETDASIELLSHATVFVHQIMTFHLFFVQKNWW